MSPAAAASQIEEENKPKSLFGRVKYFFTGEKLDRKRLAALGGCTSPVEPNAMTFAEIASAMPGKEGV